MNSKKNIEIVRDFFAKQTSDDSTSSFGALISSDAVVYGPSSLQKTAGVTHAKHIEEDYIQKYPRKKYKIDEIFSREDKVYVQWSCSGWQKKPLTADNSKDSTFSIVGFSIYQIAGEKIIRIWQYWDRLCVLEQLVEDSVQTGTMQSGQYLELLKSLGIGRYFKDVPLLSKRERQCLRALLVGETAKEVALEYGLSYRTIESYYENLKNKLNCQSKRDLFKAAQALDKLQLI